MNEVMAVRLIRFTPTYMGNTPFESKRLLRSTVHPHIHGEYIVTAIFNKGDFRFTPTYMGNTPWSARKSGCSTVHPHIHGEYIILLIAAVYIYGSPPHTWGIRDLVFLHYSILRFTPTYMGNTDGQ